MTRQREELEKICSLLGAALREEMNDLSSGPPLGYMLCIFDFGPDGFMTYNSNAQRADMVKTLRELIRHLEMN